jgi:hypothetical protein
VKNGEDFIENQQTDDPFGNLNIDCNDENKYPAMELICAEM